MILDDSDRVSSQYAEGILHPLSSYDPVDDHASEDSMSRLWSHTL
jgi:hypothetical protein